MAAVCVHVGQAGCQLAQAVWPVLALERPGVPDLFYLRAEREPFRPRAVLVDAEPKVVEAALAQPLAAGAGAAVAFDPAAAAWAQGGRGGNFALGYVGERARGGGEELHARALECVRKQVEGCHSACLGSLLFHSLGGGSGSGLGARVAEELRDAYAKLPLLACSMLPMASGENPAQSYNALLSLAALQELTDGVVLYENDRLMAAADAVCQRPSAAPPATSAGPAVGEGASLATMNGVVARDLAPILCPATMAEPLDLGDLVSGTCPMPTHRFLQLFSGEAASPHGHGPPAEIRPALEALSRATPRVPRAPAAGGASAVLAGRAVARGAHVPEVERLRGELLDRLGGAVRWQPFALEARCSAVPLRSAPAACRVSALVNWKRTAHVLRPLLERGRAKYASRAFVHWYEQYGFGEDVFAQAFEILEGVAADYEAA